MFDSAPAGTVALVIDAPLLFEAGLDRECDAVIFVDSPPALRLERVRRARGWDAAELARRESSQLPLDVKRSRADDTVQNAGDLDALEAQVRAALERILNRVS
jgi:dephospho-CoA kinase